MKTIIQLCGGTPELAEVRTEIKREAIKTFKHTKFCYLCNKSPEFCICREPQYAIHENIFLDLFNITEEDLKCQEK